MLKYVLMLLTSTALAGSSLINPGGGSGGVTTGQVNTLISARGYTTTQVVESILAEATNNFLAGAHTWAESQYSSVDHTEIAPAGNEFATADWVRGLALQGAEWFFTTSRTNGFGEKTTNFVALAGELPAGNFSNVVAATTGAYIAGGVTTNTYTGFRGPVTFEMYLARVGGNAASVLQVHPELYYVYDNGGTIVTNHFGDWEVANQLVSSTVPARFRFTVAFPTPTITGSVHLIGYLKCGTVSGSAASIAIYGGTLYPSHMSIPGVESGSGGSSFPLTSDVGAGGYGISNLAHLSFTSAPTFKVTGVITAAVLSSTEYVTKPASALTNYVRNADAWVDVALVEAAPKAAEPVTTNLTVEYGHLVSNQWNTFSFAGSGTVTRLALALYATTGTGNPVTGWKLRIASDPATTGATTNWQIGGSNGLYMPRLGHSIFWVTQTSAEYGALSAANELSGEYFNSYPIPFLSNLVISIKPFDAIPRTSNSVCWINAEVAPYKNMFGEHERLYARPNELSLLSTPALTKFSTNVVAYVSNGLPCHVVALWSAIVCSNSFNSLEGNWVIRNVGDTRFTDAPMLWTGTEDIFPAGSFYFAWGARATDRYGVALITNSIAAFGGSALQGAVCAFRRWPVGEGPYTTNGVEVLWQNGVTNQPPNITPVVGDAWNDTVLWYYTQ